MSERETAEAIDESAIAWVARLDSAGDDPRTRAELDAWLDVDDRRRGAFFRATVAWSMLDRASVLRADGNSAPSRASAGVRVSRRGLWWIGGAAAASIAVSVAGLESWPIPRRRSRSTSIETATGEIRQVALADGTLAAVNTRSRLAVNLEPEVRTVALAEGEAWFKVAKDRARPFVVEAGNVRVKAVGTAFSVRRTDAGADVQVTEGVVEVWSVGRDADPRRVTAGARTFVGDTTGPSSVMPAGGDIDRTLAWRTGQLIFEGDTCADAATEFNRYNDVKIRIADPALGQEKVVGRFRTNEPDAFARAAAGLLNARVDTAGDEIILSRK